MRTTADDLLSFLLRSSATLSTATEHAVTLRLASVAATTSEAAHCENVAVAALMVGSVAIKVAALRLLERRGAPRMLPVLRDLVCDGDAPREVRAAAEDAYRAIEAREIASYPAWTKTPRVAS